MFLLKEDVKVPPRRMRFWDRAGAVLPVMGRCLTVPLGTMNANPGKGDLQFCIDSHIM